MKYIPIALLTLFTVACSNTTGSVSDASPNEINMADAMGITVEELRDQTPEDHMKMMRGMMNKKAPSADNRT